MAQPRRPLLRLTWSDPESDATGFVVVDRLVTGIATGACGLGQAARWRKSRTWLGRCP